MEKATQRAEEAPDVHALRARVAGRVAVPGDEDWDAARQAWNLAVDQRPALVVLAESAEDVVETVRFAADNGFRVAAQGTGHNASPLGDLSDTVLLKTSRMRAVEIDPEARRARVEAGTLWAEVTAAAAEHGLAGLAGSSPDVGVVGYTLGGGVSWLSRRFGLAANSVHAVELVTADGELVRADRDHHPDLFWALRGGGGSFGIVTALEFELYPIREVYAGAMFWPLDRAAEILAAWRDWAETTPDEVTSCGRLLNIPPLPEIPEPLRGRSFVVVEAVYLGDEAEGAELISPLRELGPQIDTVTTIPVAALEKLHMDPEHPVAGVGEGMLLRTLPAEAIDIAVAAVAGDSPLFGLEFRQLGGALGRVAPGHGAIAGLDAGYAMFSGGVAMTPEQKTGVYVHLGRLLTALKPWDSGRTYMNFAERRTEGSRLFPELTWRRLMMIKAQYDPLDVIRSNHPIPAVC
ncbi:MAG TPA: FAD-binding protein [Gaiellaceae bacterium]|jgi:FAD/FMN-containing dehydrogenase